MRKYGLRPIRFGVNKQVIEIRLDRERIWPAE